jgi:hypothetical protein
VVAKVKDYLAVSKQTAQYFDGKRFNLTKQMSCMLGNRIRLIFQTGL